MSSQGLIFLLAFLTLLIVQAKSQSSTFQRDETWLLSELRERDSKRRLDVPAGEYIELSFHGDNCVTINSKCTSISGIFIRVNSPYELSEIKAKVISVYCPDDFFDDQMRILSKAISVPHRESEYLEVHSTEYDLIFKRGLPSKPLTCVDRCSLEPDGGMCRALFTKYYYDQVEGRCKEFEWGGCDGSVPFETMQDCLQHCADR